MRPAADHPTTVMAAFEALRTAGIAWTLLRPVESLQRPDGDIDLLVAPARLAGAERALAGAGYVRVPHGDPADLHAVAHDAAAARFRWLHVQTSVRAGAARVDAEALLGHARDDGAVATLDPTALAWVLVLHALDAGQPVAERHRAAVGQLAPGGDVPAWASRALAEHGVGAPAVLDLVAAGDWPGLAQLGEERFRRPPGGRERLRGRAVALGRWRARRGLTVAALGPDGAGKTTLVEGLRATLPWPTATVYMGLTGGRMPLADRLRVPGLVLGGRIALHWARHVSAALERARGKVVLFDRHVLDAEVPSGADLGPLRRRGRRIEGRSVPVPDVVLVLDAPGATMLARKGEYDAVTLERWREAYLRVADRLGPAHVLDATEPAEVVLGRAQAIVWAELSRRWSARPG